MPHTQALREHLVAMLKGGQAYETFDDIVGEFPAGVRGAVPVKTQRSAWQILEHMRLSLRDILEYSQNESGAYVEKDWPEGYWPKEPEPPSPTSWDDAIKAYKKDLDELAELAQTGDLFAPFPWKEKHNLLREILLAAEHASYHLGQLVVVRELL